MNANFPTHQQFDTFVHFLSRFVSALPKIGLLVVIAIVAGFVIGKLTIVLVRLLDLRRLLDRDMIFLELTPPAFADKTPLATQQFFSDLHGLETIRSVRDKMLQRKSAFTVEMVGIREQGIRFIFCIPKENRESFEHDIASFDTNIQVRETDDYLSKSQRLHARLLELHLKERYYPLKDQQSYDQSDPIDYLLGSMSNLQAGELMVIQLVLSPTKVRNADRISNRLLYNKEHLDTLGKKHHRSFGGVLIQGINSALFSITNTIGEVHQGSSSYSSQIHQNTMQHHHQVAQGIKPARSMGALESMLAMQVSEKLNSNLYRTNVRGLIVANSLHTSVVRANDIRKSFNVYKTKYQAVVSRLDFPYGIRGRYRLFMFQHRLPGIFNRYASLLSATEVADIYHFPNSETNRNAEVVKSLNKTLDVPLSIKNYADAQAFDVVIGKNEHHRTITPVGLIEKERERHQYIIGGTGNGKTTMLQYQIVQDMQNGKGVAIVDPHGDMAETLLCYVPPERIKDVVYFNPDDLAYPIGLNLLELTPGLAGNDLLREKDIITESVISVFRKIFSEDDSGGHRIEYVLRNAVQTALTLPDATLFTIFDLLNDPKYRKGVIKKLEDKNLINFWRNELGKAGGMQQVKMAAGITAKIGRFLFSASAKQILEQPKSTIDFDDIINSGKILICNFSKGLLGEDTSELFGITVLAKLQLASLRRARLNQTERRAFYLYVDEFQNFATTSFVQMLSEARKYKLFLTMAEQSTSQQKDQQMVNIILANVGTVICFRTGNPQDEKMLLPLFSPYIDQGEISNLPAYNFYAKLSAIHAQEPLSGQTLLLADEGKSEVRDAVIEHSRAVFAKKKEAEEKEEIQLKRVKSSSVKNKKVRAKPEPLLTGEPMIDEL